MTIGERIKRIRIKCGMTQKEFGLALGFPASSASGWINIIRITSICWKCWKSGMPLGNRITMILPLWMNTRTGS